MVFRHFIHFFFFLLQHTVSTLSKKEILEFVRRFKKWEHSFSFLAICIRYSHQNLFVWLFDWFLERHPYSIRAILHVKKIYIFTNQKFIFPWITWDCVGHSIFLGFGFYAKIHTYEPVPFHLPFALRLAWKILINDKSFWKSFPK